MDSSQNQPPLPHPSRSRPALVWIICGLYVLSSLLAVPAILAATSGALQMNEAATSFYKQFGPLNYVGVVASVLLSIGFVIALFRLKRVALVFVVLLFLVGALKTAAYWTTMLELGQTAPTMLAGVILNLAVIIYAWRLTHKGVLQ